MSDDEINKAIAEACGWRYEIRRSYRETPAWYRGVSQYDYPPDYCNDLNAMHEAEKLIVEADSEVRSRWFIKMQQIGTCAGTHATARQRAEAFLCTVSKKPLDDAAQLGVA